MSIGGLFAMLVGLFAVLGGLVLLVLGKACLDLTSKQVQSWLFDLCFVILRLARRRLPIALRVIRHDEELVPELKWILFDRYANQPVVALYKGFCFAFGHVRGAKRLARESAVQAAHPRTKPKHGVPRNARKDVLQAVDPRTKPGHRAPRRGLYVRGHYRDGHWVKPHYRRRTIMAQPPF